MKLVKPLSYLIGADSAGQGDGNRIIVAPYDEPRAKSGYEHVGYCNLLDERESYNAETNTGDYGPYKPQSDTAEEYDEGVIDPEGIGWLRNLNDQFTRRRLQRFNFVELDNPDSYRIQDVLNAIDIAVKFGLNVIAKNPLEMGPKAARLYVAHPHIFGVIVEKGCGNPREMDELRRYVNKPDLPIWFVSFGNGRRWASDTAKCAANYKGMGVTYSTQGEYVNVIDLLVPL